MPLYVYSYLLRSPNVHTSLFASPPLVAGLTHSTLSNGVLGAVLAMRPGSYLKAALHQEPA